MKFKTEKLGQYLYIKGRIGWKGLKKNEYLNEGEYRIINGESLSSNGIDWNKAGYITEERYEESPEIKLQENDILISKDGTIGKIGFVKKLSKPSTVASGIFVIRNNNKEQIDTRFIYHYLRSPYFRNFIKARTEGSVIPHLYQKDFVELDFPLCSLLEQKKISSILDAIDEKIQVNKDINDNLSQQMEAMYRNMVASVGSDHQSVTVDQFCNIFTGKKNANQFDENGRYMFFTCGEKTLKINSYIYDGPAVIISGNGSYTGRTMFYNGKFDLYQRTYACTLKPEHPSEYIYALYAILKIALHRKISGGTHGSSIPYIVMNDIAKFEFNIKHDEFMIFAQQSKAILDVIQHNNNENSNLAKMRDCLLPKLMSGEIDVSNIDL